jgi:phosphomannomutase
LMYPVSGEINRKIEDTTALMKLVEKTYGAGALAVDKTDGLSFEFSTWRFNIRSSNTEPVVRLNVESRGSKELMQEKTGELLDLMGGEPA